MSEAVLLCCAVPDESRGLRDIDPGSATVHHTGAGYSARARNALAQRLAETRPRYVISAGYAGGLDPQLATGDLIAATNFSAPELLAGAQRILANEPLHLGVLQTEAHAAETATAKAALHQATGALAVDMETAWIAELCAEKGVPLLSLRVISDAAGDDFPVPGHILYDAGRQRPRYLALPFWLAVHPGHIGPFAQFVRSLGPARERLTRAIRALLGGPSTTLPAAPSSAMNSIP